MPQPELMNIVGGRHDPALLDDELRLRVSPRIRFFVRLARLQFAGSHLLASLLSFNVGAELGQLLVLVLLVRVLSAGTAFSAGRGRTHRVSSRQG
jgi:hypothetical protein